MAKAKKKEEPKEGRLTAQRGSLVKLRDSSYEQAIIVSNDVQNEFSDYVLAVPLERRNSRLKADFVVDLGRSDGLRELHSARCDWVTRFHLSEVESIERARFPDKVVDKLEAALKVALGFREVA